MATPYIGEIRPFSFAFPPKGWALCNGQLLPINQNQALFSLLGTTYGGNGTTTFALPDLRGRMVLHEGGGYTLGESAGEVGHTLTVAEMPAHTHTPRGSTAVGNLPSPAGAVWAEDNGDNTTYASTGNEPMSSKAIATTGASQPHENEMPYLTINYCIALQGIFPSRN